MKKTPYLRLATLFVIVCGLLITTNVNAAVLVDENFEDGNAGVMSGIGGEIRIVSDPTNSGKGNVLSLYYQYDGSAGRGTNVDRNRNIQYSRKLKVGETLFFKGDVYLDTPTLTSSTGFVQRKLLYFRADGSPLFNWMYDVLKLNNDSLGIEAGFVGPGGMNYSGGNSGKLQARKWHTVETQTTMPSVIGASDGILRVWVDGVQTLEVLNWKITDAGWIGMLPPSGGGVSGSGPGGTMTADDIYFNVYWIGDQTQADFPYNEYRYWDNIVFSTTRAGTSVPPPPTTPTPPTPPSDTVSPLVSLLTPPNGSIISGSSVTLSAGATDNVGVIGVQFKINGANVGAEDTTSPYSTIWNSLSLPNGAHSLTATARDGAGNTGTSQAFTINISNASVPLPPTNFKASPGSCGTGAINLSWSGSSGASTYQLYRNGTLIYNSTGLSYQDAGLYPGASYTYIIRATNSAGSSIAASTVPGGTIAPPVCYVPPPPPPTLTCTSVPADTFQACYYAGMNFNTLKMVRNENQINNDWGTNSPDSSVPVEQFSATWTGNFNFNSSTYNFSVQTDDGIRVYIDDASALDKWIDQAPTAYTFARSMSAGRHKVRVEYYENGGGAVAKVSWAPSAVTTPPADTTAPTVSITAPLAGYTISGGSVPFTAIATDNVGVIGVQFKIDGSNFRSEANSSPYTTTIDTTTLSNGSHTLTATARDGAGNTGVSQTVNVNVSNKTIISPPTDTTAPILSNLKAVLKNKNSITLSVRTDESATCRYSALRNTPYQGMETKFSSTGSSNHSTTISKPSVGSSYTFYVRCIDKAGNANPADSMISFKIEGTGNKPVLTLINFAIVAGASSETLLPVTDPAIILVLSYRSAILEAQRQGIIVPQTLLDILNAYPTSSVLGLSTLSLSSSKDLTLKSEGDEVRMLQEFLIKENQGPASQALYIEGASGYFGNITRNALIEYQTSKGITPADGYFGEKTKAYLRSVGL